jgi:hypothetical protein
MPLTEYLITTQPLPPCVVASVVLPIPPTPTPVAHVGDVATAAKVFAGEPAKTKTNVVESKMHRHAKRRTAIPAFFMHARGVMPDLAPPAFILMNYRYHLEITANRPERLPDLTTGLVTQTLNLSKRVTNKC